MSEEQTNNFFGQCGLQSFCGGCAEQMMQASSYLPTRDSNGVNQTLIWSFSQL